MKTTFKCTVCKKTLPIMTSGGTGYGRDPKTNRMVCYECCGKRDAEEMKTAKRFTLYLSIDKENGLAKVTNWPGTLSMKVREMRTGRHNIAGSRCDVWFYSPDGSLWHGVQYGEWTQICHCQRIAV
jgi:hypothetical protein